MKFTKYLFTFLIIIFGTSLYAQDRMIKEKIINNSNIKELNTLSNDFRLRSEKSKKDAIEIAKEKSLPIRGYHKDKSYFEIKGVDFWGNILYYSTNNKGSRLTARVNSISTGGDLGLNLDGQDMIVGVWDAGIPLTNHVELSDRITLKDIDPTSTILPAISFHSTHVTGTIASSGKFVPNSKGIAPKAKVWYNDWNNDIYEMTIQAAEGLLVSNHSYGIDTKKENSTLPSWYFGFYNQIASDFDKIAYNAPYYQTVVAAGNDRDKYTELNASKGGNDLLLGASLSKNSVVVAAVKDVPDYTSPNQVIMTTFSSYGPTDDFRIKPDISAKGFQVLSTSYSELTPKFKSRYDKFNGTSMAAPSVSGVFVLWQQYAIQLNKQAYRSATLRALLVQTADEAGKNPGPDHMFGWGLVNATRGVEVMRDSGLETAFIGEETLLQAGIYEQEFEVKEKNKNLSATIAWTDKESIPYESFVVSEMDDNSTPVLVNDLDLRIYKDSIEFLPWKLNRDFNLLTALKGDNIVDNIEKVEIPDAEIGTYKIVVTHKGVLYSGKQDFSIVISEKDMDSNLSINQNTLPDDSIKIWPNPAIDFVNIESSSDILKNAEIAVFDITGKELFKTYNKDSSSEIIHIPLNNLPKGVYLIVIKNSKGQIVRKIFVGE